MIPPSCFLFTLSVAEKKGNLQARRRRACGGEPSENKIGGRGKPRRRARWAFLPLRTKCLFNWKNERSYVVSCVFFFFLLKMQTSAPTLCAVPASRVPSPADPTRVKPTRGEYRLRSFCSCLLWMDRTKYERFFFFKNLRGAVPMMCRIFPP